MSNLVSMILILASLGLFFGYINPTYRAVTGRETLSEKSITELKEESARYSDALGKAREIELVRTGLLEKYNAISQDKQDALLKLLPDHIDSVRLIIDINNMADAHGMTLKNITLLDSGEESSKSKSTGLGLSDKLYKDVAFKFSVNGSYDTFRAFLQDLEKSLRLIDVESVAFGSDSSSTYDYSMTIRTYRLQ